MKLTFSVPEVLGARIEPCGLKDSNSPCGVGDSILLDFKNRIFAVADSPDWNPAASKIYLSRFSSIVEEIFALYPDTRKAGIEIQKQVIVDHTNRLVKEIDRKFCTAFSSIIIIEHGGKLKGLLLHCGDCFIFKINIRQRDIVQITRTNMNYIGCSDQISQIEVIDIDEDDRFVLCTDGLQALSRNAYSKSIHDILLHSLTSCPVHDIPDTLLNLYGNNIIPDDMAVVVLNPNEPMVSDDIVVMGGYEPGEM